MMEVSISTKILWYQTNFDVYDNGKYNLHLAMLGVPVKIILYFFRLQKRLANNKSKQIFYGVCRYRHREGRVDGTYKQMCAGFTKET